MYWFASRPWIGDVAVTPQGGWQEGHTCTGPLLDCQTDRWTAAPRMSHPWEGGRTDGWTRAGAHLEGDWVVVTPHEDLPLVGPRLQAVALQHLQTGSGISPKPCRALCKQAAGASSLAHALPQCCLAVRGVLGCGPELSGPRQGKRPACRHQASLVAMSLGCGSHIRMPFAQDNVPCTSPNATRYPPAFHAHCCERTGLGLGVVSTSADSPVRRELGFGLGCDLHC
jgi:hypothetical protein